MNKLKSIQEEAQGKFNNEFGNVQRNELQTDNQIDEFLYDIETFINSQIEKAYKQGQEDIIKMINK